MTKISDPKKFKAIKGRVQALFQNHADDIEKGNFLTMAADVAKEMAWLVRECERLSKGTDDAVTGDVVSEGAEGAG